MFFVNLSTLGVSTCLGASLRNALQLNATVLLSIYLRHLPCRSDPLLVLAYRAATQLNATVDYAIYYRNVWQHGATFHGAARRNATQRNGSFVDLSSLGFLTHQAAASLIASLYNATE